MSTSGPALARKPASRRNRFGLLSAAESGVGSHAADGKPIAALLNGSDSCHHCSTMDRNSSTEAPKFKSQANASYVPQKRWMSFARKASRDPFERSMSSKHFTASNSVRLFCMAGGERDMHQSQSSLRSWSCVLVILRDVP
jgi:hypothetical protein